MEEIFFNELETDEQIVWSGKEIRKLFSKGDIMQLPFYIIWLGFACYWEITAIKQGAPFVMILFGIPFVLIGIFMLVGTPIRRITGPEKIYAVTNKRLIFCSKGRNINFQFVDLSNAEIINKFVNRKGEGTIYFKLNYLDDNFEFDGNGYAQTNRRRYYDNKCAFNNIEDVNSVCNIIKSTKNNLYI